MTWRTALDDLAGHDSTRVELGKLRTVAAKDLATRAAFGAAVSLVAGILGEAVNARFGGLFLAFPAILPASLTLVEQRDGTRAARQSARGAIFGAVGLVAFALVAARLLAAHRWQLAVVLALGAWVLVSFALYAVARALGRPARR